MLVTNFTALAIYNQRRLRHRPLADGAEPRDPGRRYAAIRLRRPAGSWMRIHAGAMAVNYFLLLFAGINEAFLHLLWLTHLGVKLDLPLLGIAVLELLAAAALTLLHLLRVTARGCTPPAATDVDLFTICSYFVCKG